MHFVRQALGATPWLVIPGRAKREPGIHFATAQVVEWIPGLRLRRIPE
jgi:hypothetical protein